jgi:hypothetical protein
MTLFTDRSILTMVHGIVLGGGSLIGLAAAWFLLHATRRSAAWRAVPPAEARDFATLAVGTAVLLWITVILGTYVVFPPYRATPPAGLADLAAYPRSLLLANPDTAWLHAFAMETKEHMPWIASMLATAVAFVAVRFQAAILEDRRLRSMAAALLAIAFVLASFAGLMGIFVNKAAPLE